jgi:phospholipase/carboxylesterase
MISMRAVLLAVMLAPACGKQAPQPTAVGTKPQREALPAAPEPEPEAPPLPVAGELAYLEVMLGGAQPEEAVPMIVAIHGLGDEPQNFAGLFDGFPEPARLILPRAPDPFADGGWSWFPIRASDRDVDSLSRGIEAGADKIARSIAVLHKERPTVGTPIVTGFSQGGMLSFALAVHHPDLVSVAVPVGGWLPPPLWPAGKGTNTPYPKIVALHGTADTAVYFDMTKEAVDHLATLGFDVALNPYEDIPHVLTPEIRHDLSRTVADAVRTSASVTSQR